MNSVFKVSIHCTHREDVWH